MQSSNIPVWRDLPVLVRFMLTRIAGGIAIGWALLIGFLQWDPLGVGALLSGHPDGGLATALLFAAFAVTFGSVGVGIAVMNLPWDNSPGGGKTCRNTEASPGACPEPTTSS